MHVQMLEVIGMSVYTSDNMFFLEESKWSSMNLKVDDGVNIMGLQVNVSKTEVVVFDGENGGNNWKLYVFSEKNWSKQLLCVLW